MKFRNLIITVGLAILLVVAVG
ncbi:MAG: hypothetical protein K0Q65_2435, partial [Clostridia bacterium]|nr:hypothetical protein [Clostridia bacterium]